VLQILAPMAQLLCPSMGWMGWLPSVGSSLEVVKEIGMRAKAALL